MKEQRAPLRVAAILSLIGLVSCGARPPEEGDIVLNEYLPAPLVADVNCDGVWSGTTDEFIELVSVASRTLDLSDVTLSDSAGVTHTFSSGTELEPNGVIVVYGGGTPTCALPAGVAVEVASTGSLSLNDDGDVITIKNAEGTTIDVSGYSVTRSDVSYCRDPELSGSFVYHEAIIAANGSTYSPGRKADGSEF